MKLKQRIQAFVHLKKWIDDLLTIENLFDSELAEFKSESQVLLRAHHKNGWFTETEIRRALNGISIMLDEENLNSWLMSYPNSEVRKKVALIMAGNIPAVGFHDLLCVLATGNLALLKLSSQDNELIPMLLDKLCEIEPGFDNFFTISQGKLVGFDAVIATGNNNSARYFDYYFKHYPTLIRKNRTSIAVIDEGVSQLDLEKLGEDIFSYYGLGCRNVSKVFIPKHFELDRLFNAVFKYGYVIDNKKYANNHAYNQTLFLLNKETFLDNNFMILKEDNGLHSPIGVLYYQRYDSINEVNEFVKEHEEQLQIIVSKSNVPFGKGQYPLVTDYADHINTLDFLANLAHH